MDVEGLFPNNHWTVHVFWNKSLKLVCTDIQNEAVRSANMSWMLKVCSHVTSPSSSKFNIVSIVKDTLIGTMDCTPILSTKVYIKKIKGTAHKNGDVDGTCKRRLSTRCLTILASRGYSVGQYRRCSSCNHYCNHGNFPHHPTRNYSESVSASHR